MDTRTPTAHLPRVRINLDDDGVLDARIWWWLTEDDETRWALVEWNGWVARQRHVHLMCVPAERVELLDGVNYRGVIEKGGPSALPR
ncbi:hypothetical protein ACIBSV_46905 [Embleya sp. NPDC050154]|uniref:hypothetical protein n=1 Tax=Embleya sp. NPDC050154 TaxID=3363988 RepID=UPI00379A0C46